MYVCMYYKAHRKKQLYTERLQMHGCMQVSLSVTARPVHPPAPLLLAPLLLLLAADAASADAADVAVMVL